MIADRISARLMSMSPRRGRVDTERRVTVSRCTIDNEGVDRPQSLQDSNGAGVR